MTLLLFFVNYYIILDKFGEKKSKTICRPT